MHLLPAAAAAVAFMATSSSADEVIGEISAVIDGAPTAWQTLRPEGEDVSSGTNYRNFGFVWQVRLLGHASGGEEAAGDRLALSFSGADGATEATEAMIMLLDAESGRSYYSAETGAGLVRVDRLDLKPDRAYVSGDFTARLCFKEGLFSAPDPTDCREISGSFVSRLPLDDS